MESLQADLAPKLRISRKFEFLSVDEKDQRLAEAASRSLLLGLSTKGQDQRLDQHRAEHYIPHCCSSGVGGHILDLELRNLAQMVAIEVESTLGKFEASLFDPP